MNGFPNSATVISSSSVLNPVWILAVSKEKSVRPKMSGGGVEIGRRMVKSWTVMV
jgi:hypothetical protein